MPDTPDVLKRLEEIERRTEPASPDWEPWYDDVRWLLKLNHALLVSQGELLVRVGNQECRCREMRRATTTSTQRQDCPRCVMIARAERVRKGEV